MQTAPEPSRDLARLMLMMRRMIREEFAVTVPISDSEATGELLAFAGRSRNTLLRQMARELEGHLTDSGTSAMPGDKASTPAITTYRGAPVAARTEDTPAEHAHAPRPKRVYRGHVIG